MAGESIVGALRVVLGMDTASFEDGANRASKSVADFGSHMKATFAGVGLERIVERVFDRIVHTFKETVVQAFEFADQMSKMAQKVGVTTEELTGLRLAAELSDVSMETLSKSLGILSKNMVAAANGGEEMKKEFAALGISVNDSSGDLKSVIDVLVELADKFEHSKDGAVKVDAALKLLGRGGKELIPLLNEGGGSLREFAKVAQQMGLVVSTETGKQVQQFNDDLKILRLSTQGVANLVLKEMIPILGSLSKSFADTAKKGDGIRTTADFIVKGFKEIVVWAIIAAEVNEKLGRAYELSQQAAALAGQETGKTLTPAAKQLSSEVNDLFGGINKLIGGLVSLKEEGKRTSLSAEELAATLDEVQSQSFNTNTALGKLAEARNIIASLEGVISRARDRLKELEKGADTAVPKLKPDLDTVNKDMDKFTERLKQINAQTLEASGIFSGQLAPGFLSAAEGMKALDGQVINVRDRFIQLGPEAQKLNQAMLALQGAKLIGDLTPLGLYEQKLIQLNALVAQHPVLAQQAADAATRAGFQLASDYGRVAQSIVDPLASAFKDLASMNKKWAAAAKAAAIGQAIVNTYVAATKALADPFLPFPLNYAAAAAVTAAGLAQVAKISAQEFATGGSFRIGGGLGGIDNQLVTIKGTPGEMVDIRRPGQDRGSGSTVNLALPARGSVSTDDVRGLIETINGAIRDGYRINLAAT